MVAEILDVIEENFESIKKDPTITDEIRYNKINVLYKSTIKLNHKVDEERYGQLLGEIYEEVNKLRTRNNGSK